jgi:hypothetical protein
LETGTGQSKLLVNASPIRKEKMKGNKSFWGSTAAG